MIRFGRKFLGRIDVEVRLSRWLAHGPRQIAQRSTRQRFTARLAAEHIEQIDSEHEQSIDFDLQVCRLLY